MRPRVFHAAEVVLMFHRGVVWTDQMRKRWRELTGSQDATTKVMCDTVRAAVGEGAPDGD